MKTKARTVTDYFGTRLDPSALEDGLRALGLARFSLSLTDKELILRSSGASGDQEERATAWLRGVMSPLWPCRVERSNVAGEKLDGRFVDRRRGPPMTVALGEVFDEEDGARVEADLRSRLGSPDGKGVRLVSWRRPGGKSGVRSATILAASRETKALAWLKDAMADEPAAAPPAGSVLLDGLEWGVARRPTIAARASRADAPPILVDAARCGGCGLCSELCPTQSLVPGGTFQGAGAA